MENFPEKTRKALAKADVFAVDATVVVDQIEGKFHCYQKPAMHMRSLFKQSRLLYYMVGKFKQRDNDTPSPVYLSVLSRGVSTHMHKLGRGGGMFFTNGEYLHQRKLNVYMFSPIMNFPTPGQCPPYGCEIKKRSPFKSYTRLLLHLAK
jgi:hypothetical protein